MPRKKIERTDKYCVAYVTVNADGTPVLSYYGHLKKLDMSFKIKRREI